MLLVQSQAYEQQYHFNSIVVFPTNLFGPRDNFDDNTSHVIPAIIKKVSLAKKNKLNYISLWGDGSPTRDFLYVDDAANGIVLAAEKYNKSEPLNLGTGKEVSIKGLAIKIIKLMASDLEIKWLTNKPNGQPRRCVSVERAKREIGFDPQVDLDDGLRRTIEWYQSNKVNQTIA